MIDNTTILKAGTPVYVTDPGTMARGTRHVATVTRPMRDYGRTTASYYVVRLHNGIERVYSSDYVELRYEGVDARNPAPSHLTTVPVGRA